MHASRAHCFFLVLLQSVITIFTGCALGETSIISTPVPKSTADKPPAFSDSLCIDGMVINMRAAGCERVNFTRDIHTGAIWIKCVHSDLETMESNKWARNVFIMITDRSLMDVKDFKEDTNDGKVPPADKKKPADKAKPVHHPQPVKKKTLFPTGFWPLCADDEVSIGILDHTDASNN